MNGHFSLFFENGMIRYLYSKVNLWEGKYFFFMREDKMIYQAGCLENKPKKREQATFSGRKVRKMEKEKKETQKMGPKKWGLAPFFVHTEKVACPLF
jgi:hypothetical protein